MTDKIPVPPVGAAPASAEHFRIASQKPAVKFLSRGVQPPSQIYVTNTDVLSISVASDTPTEVVTVSYRLLRSDGELVFGQFIALAGPNRAAVTTPEPLAEGFLLTVSCRAFFSTTRGQTFVRAFLTNPTLGTGQPSYTLFSDYVTTAVSPAHPNGRALSPVEGPGWARPITTADPAPASGWVITQPANARWRLMAATAVFTSSAAVGNRNNGLTIGTSGIAIWFGWANQAVPASTAASVFGGNSFLPAPLGLNFVNIPFPSDLQLTQGGFVQSTTVGMQAADQWRNITILVEEWFDNV